MVEPIHERVLIVKASPHKLIDAGKRQGAIAPRAIGEDHCARAPTQEIVKSQVSSQPRSWDNVDAGMGQLAVDLVHLLLALLLVPARKTVLDFPIRVIVLIQYDAGHILLCELERGLRSSDSSTDDDH